MPANEKTGAVTMLSRTILAPWDILADTTQAQHLALMFDRILLWRLNRHEENEAQQARLEAEASFLASQNVVARIGLQAPFTPAGALTRNCEMVVPVELTLGKPPPFARNLSPLDQLLRTVASGMQVDGAPVAVQMDASAFPSAVDAQPVLEVIIERVPMPPIGMPWQDLIQFRSDPENVQLLRKLRLWAQERALATKPARHVAEELEALLVDYQKYMQIQHQKYSAGIVSTLIVAGLEQLAELTSASFVRTAAKAWFTLKERRILLAEAELKAPGREVAYIAKATDLVTGG